MKIRTGFITNSSSTNFLIISRKELTEDYLFEKLGLNKIAARWPAKAVAQFFYFIEKIKKAVEILFVIRYCLVTTQKQLNTESPTAYEYNIIFRCHPQQEL